MASSSWKLTATEQGKFPANFYKEIYQEEWNFVTNEEVSAFVDEDEPDDDIHDNVVETKAGIDGEQVIDLNRDAEAPEVATNSQKQKFLNYEKVCDSSNFDRLPDQEETFTWSNKGGDC